MLASPKAGEYLVSFYFIALSFFCARITHLTGPFGGYIVISGFLISFKPLVLISRAADRLCACALGLGM